MVDRPNKSTKGIEGILTVAVKHHTGHKIIGFGNIKWRELNGVLLGG